jgi:hypothetical protein
MEFILDQLTHVAVLQVKAAEQQAKVVEQQAKIVEQQARTDKRLDRAIRLGVVEARRERKKRRELGDRLTQLAAAQLVTEEKLQRFLESRSGTNGSR